tara:strand:+ start:286 stop:498 length:213 start_codon:yes stop_codon:yes gene_type:complete
VNEERERARAVVDRLVQTGEFFEEGPKGREAIERLTAAEEGAETSGIVISEADLKKLEGEWRGNNKAAEE